MYIHTYTCVDSPILVISSSTISSIWLLDHNFLIHDRYDRRSTIKGRETRVYSTLLSHLHVSTRPWCPTTRPLECLFLKLFFPLRIGERTMYPSSCFLNLSFPLAIFFAFLTHTRRPQLFETTIGFFFRFVSIQSSFPSSPHTTHHSPIIQSSIITTTPIPTPPIFLRTIYL